jgi:cbb3-type cytochrome oxidase subunit 3
LLYFTFETLLVFGLLYLASIPVSYFIYQKQNKKEISETIDDEHEDVL